MSKRTRLTLNPPPPPIEDVAGRGETAVPLELDSQFGAGAHQALADLLNDLNGKGGAALLQEYGFGQLQSQFAWRQVSYSDREYALTLTGDALPAELRVGADPKLVVSVRLGANVVRLSHQFHAGDVNVKQHPQRVIDQRARQAAHRVFNSLNVLSKARTVATKIEQAIPQAQRRERVMSKRLVNAQQGQIRLTTTVRNLAGR